MYDGVLSDAIAESTHSTGPMYIKYVIICEYFRKISHMCDGSM